MEIVRRVHSMKDISRQARARGLRVGFVPTMGSLHEGHLSLVRRVKDLCDVTVVSLFVNPTQFAPADDFESYPRNLTQDADLCIAEGVDYLFVPEVRDLYPQGPGTWVEVAELTHKLEGASRPGHFRGVATVVLKLFCIVEPAVAAFGQKDAQQLIIIRRMIEDLMLDVELVEGPIVRDDDGVALSSRNARLEPEQRRAAAAIPRALESARTALAEGQRDGEALVGVVREVLEQDPLLRVDYVALVDRRQFEPLAAVESDALLLVAVYAGEVRLIDNAVLDVKT